MPTPTKGARLGGSPAHQKAILSNLATSLFEHGAITTTEAKARRLRPFAERLITKAKRGDLHNRRQVLAVVRDKGVVHLLFTEIGPRYANRPGGYTRITKLGPRQGDSAPMAVIELVQGEVTSQSRSTKKAATPAPAKRVIGRRKASAEAPVVSDEAGIDEAVADEAVTDEAVVDGAVADEADADEAGTDEAVADEADADEAGTDEAATDEAGTDEATADEAPIQDEVDAPTDEAAVTDDVTPTSDEEPGTTDEEPSTSV